MITNNATSTKTVDLQIQVQIREVLLNFFAARKEANSNTCPLIAVSNSSEAFAKSSQAGKPNALSQVNNTMLDSGYDKTCYRNERELNASKHPGTPNDTIEASDGANREINKPNDVLGRGVKRRMPADNFPKIIDYSDFIGEIDAPYHDIVYTSTKIINLTAGKNISLKNCFIEKIFNTTQHGTVNLQNTSFGENCEINFHSKDITVGKDTILPCIKLMPSEQKNISTINAGFKFVGKISNCRVRNITSDMNLSYKQNGHTLNASPSASRVNAANEQQQTTITIEAGGVLQALVTNRNKVLLIIKNGAQFDGDKNVDGLTVLYDDNL